MSELPTLGTPERRTIIETAMTQQGFTFTDGQRPELLNSERVWYDKGAPNFGEGPNY